MQREEIKALIQSHYNMINRLEKLLDKEPNVLKTYGYNVNFILNTVNEVFQTNCTENTRRKRVVYARHIAIYFIRKYTLLSLGDIANSVGLTDHSTAVHSIKTAINLMETDADYFEKCQLVEEKLKASNTNLEEK
jgi:chromosomal replication initiation ATPase DnaA